MTRVIITVGNFPIESLLGQQIPMKTDKNHLFI